MFTDVITPLSSSVTHLADATGVGCFLVQGAHSALLLDTCVGLGNLAETVHSLTSFPVQVVLTHGHGDHTGGAALFDEVYLHPADLPLLKEHSLAMRMDYARSFLPPDLPLSPADFAPDRVTPTLPLADGQIFELGGVTVEIIAVPGHTHGTVCALLREERAILFGDACNPNTLLTGQHSAAVDTYLTSLKRLQTREGEYDTVYYSHGPAIGPRACLTDNIELCNRILAGTDDAVPFRFLGMELLRAAAADENFRRLDGKHGNIAYVASHIYERKES